MDAYKRGARAHHGRKHARTHALAYEDAPAHKQAGDATASASLTAANAEVQIPQKRTSRSRPAGAWPMRRHATSAGSPVRAAGPQDRTLLFTRAHARPAGAVLLTFGVHIVLLLEAIAALQKAEERRHRSVAGAPTTAGPADRAPPTPARTWEALPARARLCDVRVKPPTSRFWGSLLHCLTDLGLFHRSLSPKSRAPPHFSPGIEFLENMFCKTASNSRRSTRSRS